MARISGAEEAIILASEPRDIRDYLIKRAEQASFFGSLSEEAEADLLSRGDRLIDLSLAEYCYHRETAEALFIRDKSDWPIRALVLSNQVLKYASFITGFPECLFGSEEALYTYLSTVTTDERDILFSNPTLDDSFLEAFLSLGKPWEVMDPKQRLWALDSLAANAKLRRNRSTAEFEDGWDWYMAGQPFVAAWSLIEKLEPSCEAAKHLSVLLRELPTESHKTEGILQALQGWHSGSVDLVKEADDNSKGRLSKFQEVRQAGARLLASAHDAEPKLFFDSDDLALRCGAYEAGRNLNAHQIEAAVEQDGDLARVHLIRNVTLWHSLKMRDMLVHVVLSGAETEEPRWEFKRREWHYRKDFPKWFEAEEYSHADDRPISKSTIAQVVASIAKAPSIRSLEDRLVDVEKMQKILIWIAAIAFIILVAQEWI